jgi:phosphate transport system protein
MPTRSAGSAGKGTRATRLIWVAGNLERIADRVTNTCGLVVVLVTGKLEEIGSSKY